MIDTSGPLSKYTHINSVDGTPVLKDVDYILVEPGEHDISFSIKQVVDQGVRPFIANVGGQQVLVDAGIPRSTVSSRKDIIVTDIFEAGVKYYVDTHDLSFKPLQGKTYFLVGEPKIARSK